MTRYQALRSMGCDPLTAGMAVFINLACGIREGLIGFMHVIIEYDPSAVYDKKTKSVVEEVK